MKRNLILILSVFFFSFFISSSTFALKHDVSYIPLYSDQNYSGGTVGNGAKNPKFEIKWNSTYAPTFNTTNLNYYFTSRLSNNKCTFVNGQDNHRVTPTVTHDNTVAFYYGFDSYRYFTGGSSAHPTQYNQSFCMQTVPFGTIYSNQSNLDSHPNFDDSSLVNIPIYDRPFYSDLLPYYYDYDSIYLHDSAIDTNTGHHYNNSFKPSSVTGSPVNKFKEMIIPLGRANEDVVGSLTQGRVFRLDGVFDFSGENTTYFNWNPDLTNAKFRLVFTGKTETNFSSPTNENDYVDCTVNFISIEYSHTYQLEYTCEATLPVTYYNGNLWFYLYLSSGSDVSPQDWLWDSDGDWSFGSTWFVTDNDDTPGATWGSAPTGNHLENAPGSAQPLIPSYDQSYVDALTNLFSFNLFNPFTPIFALFTDNSSCVDIPIIAGMLNSSNITYCPWFPSSVRNIVTPVLGISSLMIAFGFIVRWLKSSDEGLIQTSKKGVD